MRHLLLLTLLFGSRLVLSQELDPNQEGIYLLYDLQLEDHRGVEFQLSTAQNPAQYADIATAIEGFFTTAIKQDFTLIIVSSGDPEYLQKPLSILDLVNIYLSLNQTNDPSNE